MKIDTQDFTLAELKAKLDIAIELLKSNDFHLLKNKAHERSITHKLGEYL